MFVFYVALSNSISKVPNTTIIQAVASIAPEAVIEILAPTSHFIKPHGFRPNSLFVGREEELEKLHERLFDKKRRSEGVAAVLLQSIPGGGKTHIARQYVYKHLKDFPGGVFWVTAKSMEQLKAGFWRIAETVALKPSQIAKLPRDPDNFVASVIDWFTSHHEWLLVLDGIHFDHDPELQSFIPDSENSSLLYTSTENNVGGDHHFMNPYVMQLPLLSAREAQQLFLLELGKKNSSTDELSEAMKLVQRMGFLPEVIHVAAKRLKETREPLAKFAKAYNQGPKLRALDTFVAVRDQLIKEESMAAINLMQIICYFSGNMPVEMISLGLKAVDLPLKANEPATGRSLNNTFKILNRYALIQRNEPEMRDATSSRSSKSSQSNLLADDLDVIRIHQVIQDFFIDSVRAADITPKWLSYAIALFTLSYTRACQRMAEAGSGGLVSDFRSYEIQGRRLLEHLNRVEKKGPVIPQSRQALEAALMDVERRIHERTHQSSIDISTGHGEGFLSIFDRTSSSSDTGPETPGINGAGNAAGYVLWDMKQRESPVSIKEEYPKAIFPVMGELQHVLDNDIGYHDIGYDSERESEAGLKGSPHTLAPYSTSPSLHGSSFTDDVSDKGKWSTIDYKKRKSKAHTIDHRTTRHLEQHRYHDRAGAFRAMLPHAPAKKEVRPHPDTAISQETVQGFIPHIFQPINDTGWLPFPIFSPHTGRPLSSGRSDTSGGSAAEVALGKISKASPPPGRGGGNIQVRSANSPRPGQGHFRSGSDQSLGIFGHLRTGTFSDAHIQGTPATITAIPIGSSPLTQTMSDQGPPAAQKADRSRLATMQASAARESLQRIPYYHPAQGPELVMPHAEVNKPLPPPQSPHSAEFASSAPIDTAGFNQRPYPVSDLDLSQSPTASSLLSRTLPVQHHAQFYPRRTGPLPVDIYPGVRAAITAPSSSDTIFLYPHAPYQSARNTQALPHHHTTGYSSQPMSRDTSAQSKTSGSSGKTGRPNSPRTAAATLTGLNDAPPLSVGISPAYGNVGLGIGIGRNILDGRPRSRAVSFTESEPGPSLPKMGSSMGSGRTSYRAFMDEAAYHAGDINRRAFAKNQTSPSIPKGNRGSQAGFSAVVDRGLHQAMHQGDFASQVDGAIFEPRIPRRPEPGTMSAPQTTTVQQIKWTSTSRSSTIGGTENVQATDMEWGGSGGSGGVKVGNIFVEFGQQEPVGFGIGVKDGWVND